MSRQYIKRNALSDEQEKLANEAVAQDTPTERDTIKALMLKLEEQAEQITAIKKENTELLEKISELNKQDKGVDRKEGDPLQNLAIIKEVETVLNNSKEKFVVSVAPFDGLNFRLTIIPPVHLREHLEDKRQKVVPSIGGEVIAKEYAVLVKNFCLVWASRHGIDSGFTNPNV